MPKIADCGALMIGVDIIEPNTPPFVMVNVPPVISSIVNLLSRALVANSAIAFSIWYSAIDSAFLITGTTNPFGAETAIEISAKSEYTNSFSSIRAFTAGHSFNAVVTALVKNDIKPRPIPCFSLKVSLYLARRSMIGCMLTSLKVVNIAVSFLTATKRLAIVLRNELIFSRRSTRSPALTGAVAVTAAAGAADLDSAFAGVA